MSRTDKIILGDIRAIVSATDECVEYAKEKGVEDTVTKAKIDAYDKISKMIQNSDFVPWD